jgi:hypothetical protein
MNKNITAAIYFSVISSNPGPLLHPAQVNVGYFLALFQSLQLPSTKSESPLSLIPLALKSYVCFSVCTQLSTEFFVFSYFDPDYPTSELTVTGLARVYCVNQNDEMTAIRNVYLALSLMEMNYSNLI